MEDAPEVCPYPHLFSRSLARSHSRAYFLATITKAVFRTVLFLLIEFGRMMRETLVFELQQRQSMVP